MSNKTQLQTNNTALDGYIARINAAKDVAASLPEAGSGGGASMETCTVTLSDDLSRTTWYYTDSNMTLQTHNNSGSIVVPINTLIFYMIEGPFGDIIPYAVANGNITHIINNMSLGVVHAYGNGLVQIYDASGSGH